MSIATRPTCWTSSKSCKSRQAVRRSGSAALNLAHVASGALDAFWATHIQPWDVAAGVLLIREAGGIVTGRDGNVRPLEPPLPGRRRPTIAPRNARSANRVLPPVSAYLLKKPSSPPFCLFYALVSSSFSQTKIAGRTFADLANLVDQQPARGRVERNLFKTPRVLCSIPLWPRASPGQLPPAAMTHFATTIRPRSIICG